MDRFDKEFHQKWFLENEPFDCWEAFDGLRANIKDFLLQETQRVEREKAKGLIARLRGDLMDFKGDWEELQDILSERLEKEILANKLP